MAYHLAIETSNYRERDLWTGVVKDKGLRVGKTLGIVSFNKTVTLERKPGGWCRVDH